jgi:hypothetical protein
MGEGSCLVGCQEPVFGANLERFCRWWGPGCDVFWLGRKAFRQRLQTALLCGESDPFTRASIHQSASPASFTCIHLNFHVAAIFSVCPTGYRPRIWPRYDSSGRFSLSGMGIM